MVRNIANSIIHDKTDQKPNLKIVESDVWRVWKYQRGIQNPYIEKEQTTRWLTENVQKDNQQSTKYKHKIKDQITRTPLKIGGYVMSSGRVSSSCTTSGTRRVTNRWQTMNEERTRRWLRQVEHIRGHLWHKYSITVNQVMVATENQQITHLITTSHSLSAAVSRWTWYNPLINFRVCAKWFYILIIILSGQCCVLLFIWPIHGMLRLNLSTPVHVLLF